LLYLSTYWLHDNAQFLKLLLAHVASESKAFELERQVVLLPVHEGTTLTDRHSEAWLQIALTPLSPPTEDV
jgi:hypothetical protein